MADVPAILNGLPVLWAGVDDTTPAGCSLVVTEYLGLPTTFLIRDGHVIGRIEVHRGQQVGYAGDRLKGGTLVVGGDSLALGRKIVAQHQHELMIRALDAGQPDAARKFRRS